MRSCPVCGAKNILDEKKLSEEAVCKVCNRIIEVNPIYSIAFTFMLVILNTLAYSIEAYYTGMFLLLIMGIRTIALHYIDTHYFPLREKV